MTSRPSSSASRACPPTDGSDAWSNLGCPRRWRFQRDAARPRRCSWPGLTAAVAGAPLRRAVLRRPSAPVSASPGHQAGAPLRQRRRRPSWSWPAHFPRPSGRGSIAARGRGPCRGRRRQLPPAIRPGLHCGGAARSFVDFVGGDLPPAIRPGLHCGAAANGEDSIYGGFPRPSGRGSIAASSTSSAWASPQSSSPGHQAGAPLRPSTSRRCPATPHDLPPAIRPGLHCGRWTPVAVQFLHRWLAMVVVVGALVEAARLYRAGHGPTRWRSRWPWWRSSYPAYSRWCTRCPSRWASPTRRGR